MNLQRLFDDFKAKEVDEYWLNSSNEWFRRLPPGKKGAIGEQLVISAIGGEKERNNRSGYDIKRGEQLIEVKLSTVQLVSSSGNSKSPMLIWRQIRPDDPYTHICFIAVYPENVRMFLVPKKEIPRENLIKMHGRGKGSSGLYQIHTRKVDCLLPWLVEYEFNHCALNRTE